MRSGILYRGSKEKNSSTLTTLTKHMPSKALQMVSVALTHSPFFTTLTWKGDIAVEGTKKAQMTMAEKLRRLCDEDDASYEQSWRSVLKAYPWDPIVREAKKRSQEAKAQGTEIKEERRKYVQHSFFKP